MVKPYSENLPVRVVGRVEAGHPVREVAETFGVSVSSVVKWSQRKRQTGSVAAKPMGSRQARSLAAQRDWMLARIAAKPDVIPFGISDCYRRRRECEILFSIFATPSHDRRAPILGERRRAALQPTVPACI